MSVLAWPQLSLARAPGVAYTTIACLTVCAGIAATVLCRASADPAVRFFLFRVLTSHIIYSHHIDDLVMGLLQQPCPAAVGVQGQSATRCCLWR